MMPLPAPRLRSRRKSYRAACRARPVVADAPRMQGARLTLVPFADEHLTARYIGWLNDAVTMQFSENRHRWHDTGSCRAYAHSFRGTPNVLWAIVETASAAHIGNI